jgi:hypothetical protein
VQDVRGLLDSVCLLEKPKRKNGEKGLELTSRTCVLRALQDNIEDDLGVGDAATDDAETDRVAYVVEHEIVQGTVFLLKNRRGCLICSGTKSKNQYDLMTKGCVLS